jgi:hypothetical protein
MQHIQHIAPLLQTLLWVVLIAGLALRFHKPVYEILTALAARISGGSGVKLGPVEIAAQLVPQGPDRKRAKAESEIRELVQNATGAQPSAPPIPRRKAEARYYQAEDLALRALQAEYGATMRRQVTTGRDPGFDGVFSKDKHLYVVEVKYYTSFVDTEKLSLSAERIGRTVESLGWPNVILLLAVVFEHPDAIQKYEARIRDTLTRLPIETELKTFALPELRSRFGISPPDDG